MPKPKKKSTKTSDRRRFNPGRPSAGGSQLTGTNVRVKRTYPGQDPKFESHPEKKVDPEKIMEAPKDEAAKHKYPPPRKDPTFRKVWMEFIDSIATRENFKVGHLNSLEILCDMHVEYEQLRTFIREHGRSYQSFGRAGMAWKFYPEVGQLKHVQAQIASYMKMLGLVLKKDHSGESGGEKDEWV